MVVLYQAGAAVATAQTNSSGVYTFLVVQPGTYDLSAIATEGTFDVAPGIVVAAGGSITQNFPPGNGTLTVSVSDGDQAAEGDSVALEATVEGTLAMLMQTEVDATGTASFTDLVAGNYTVVVVAPSGDTGQTTVAVAAGGSASTSVALAPQATLSGTITDSSSNPLDGASVFIQSTSDPQQGYAVVTAADGTYSATGVAPGTYDVTVVADGYLATTQAVIVVPGAATVNAVLVPSTTTISGTLVDTANNPVPNGEVTILDSSGHTVGMATVAANGSYQVTTAAGTNLQLQVSAEGYLPPATTVFNAAAGSATVLSPIVLVPVAIDPGSASPVTAQSQNAASPDGQPFADSVLQQVDGKNAFPNPLVPAQNGNCPTCPLCMAAYQAAMTLKQEVADAAQSANDALSGVQVFAPVLTSDLVAENAGILGSALLASAPLIAAGIAAAKSAPGAAADLAAIKLVLDNFGDKLNQLVSAAKSLGGDMLAMTQAASEIAIQNVGKQAQKDATAMESLMEGFTKWVQDQFTSPFILGLPPDAQADAKSWLDGELTPINKLVSAAMTTLVTNPYAGLMRDADELNGYVLNWQQKYRQWTWFNTRFNEAMTGLGNVYANCTCWQNPSHPQSSPCYGWYNNTSTKPHDPNNIFGPAGFGAANFVSIAETLPYTINFENEPTAGLPAQEVTITQQLDSGLNWQSFRLGSFGWGGTTYTVPANTAFYQTQIDLSATLGYDVDVTATIDERTGIATWVFTTIDPATGAIPIDPSIGFLPPDTSAGIGEGFVSYTVEANPSDPTGTVISAQATVTFYTQPPLNTASIFNTIDAGTGLTSTVAPLPGNESLTQFNVSWSGSDNSAGSALANYTIYVSDDGDPYVAWLSDTTLTSAAYIGQDGHFYAFYSVATDNAGNVQPTLTTAQASTTVATPPTLSPENLPSDTAGVAYAQTITGNSANGTVTLVASNVQGAIPGLTLAVNAAGGLTVSGTPTTVGTETFTATATDSLGMQTSRNYTIVVQPAPVWPSLQSSAAWQLGGQPLTFTVVASTLAVSGTPLEPDGAVTFYDNGTVLATVPLTVVDGQDEAVLSTSTLATGVHGISISYASSSGNFVAASTPAPVAALVFPANPVVLTVTSTSGDPTVAGSLPWAIAQADASNVATQITFAAGSGQTFATSQTITLEATMTLTDTNLVTLEGPASGVTLVGDYSQSRFPLLSVAQNAGILVQGVSVGTQTPGADGDLQVAGVLDVLQAAPNLGSAVNLTGGGTVDLGDQTLTADSLTLTDGYLLDGALSCNTLTLVNGAIGANLTGTGGLVKQGTGSVVLSGTNSYPGGTTVAGGTLVITGTGALPGGTSLTVDAGGTFIFDPSQAAVSGAGVSPAPAMAATPVASAVIAMTAGAAAEGNKALPAAAGIAPVVSADSATAAAVTPPAASGGPSSGTLTDGNTPRLAAARVFADTGRSTTVVPWELAHKTKPATLPILTAAARDAAIQAVYIQRNGRAQVGLEELWDALAPGSQNDKNPQDIQALDAVLAEYGQQ